MMVLKWHRQGCKYVFWDISRGFAEGHPKFKARFELTKDELQRRVGLTEEEALGKLAGDKPGQVHFPNRSSVIDNIHFAIGALVELIKVGAGRRWDMLPLEITNGEPPNNINGMSIAERERDGKKRLCTDMIYQREPVHAVLQGQV